MNAIKRLCLVLAIIYAVGCVKRPEYVDEFVSAYVASIESGSEFYERYTSPDDLEYLREVRPMMTPQFSITRCDFEGPGSWDCQVAFSNGKEAWVQVFARDDEVLEASLVFPPPGGLGRR
jgi:hypothetical protein